MTRLKEIAKGQKRLTKAKLFKKNTIDLFLMLPSTIYNLPTYVSPFFICVCLIFTII